MDDPGVIARIGADGEYKDMMAELKSESGTARGVLMARDYLEESGLDLHTAFCVRLGAACDMLGFKSSAGHSVTAGYYYAQVLILSRLFDRAVIGWDESIGKYRISDPIAGLEAIAGVARELESLFIDDPYEPGAMRRLEGALRETETRPDMADFLRRLRSEG